MTWRRNVGVISVAGGSSDAITAALDAHRVLSVVETHEAAYGVVHVTVVTNPDERVATLTPEGEVEPGQALTEFGQTLADELGREVTFGEHLSVPEGGETQSRDPFEQVLGADIAAFVERAAVYTRATDRALVEIAGQVGDVVYALAHNSGSVVCVTDGPLLATLPWPEETRPALVLDSGHNPTITVISNHEEDPIVYVWAASRQATPTRVEGEPAQAAAGAFIDTMMGDGAVVRELMKALPAIEPTLIRQALEQGPKALFFALGLPPGVWEYLTEEKEAEEVGDAVHPASFARSVRRVVTEASSTVSERAEAVRVRAVSARTRAETAFDAAEAFAEDVVMPIHRSWVSPALAVAETTLGIMALRYARNNRGWSMVAAGSAGVALLADAVVNSVISLAPALRRRH